MKAPRVAVLTASPTLPTRSTLEAAAREYLRDTRFEVREAADGLHLGVGGAMVRVTAVPGAVPHGEADVAAFLSLSAANGRWRLAPHAAHLTVTLEGALETPGTGLLGRLAGPRRASQLETLCTFTRAAAAVTRAAGGLGVHWADAPATHAPDFFCQLARDATVPLPLWVGVSVTPEDGARTSLLSFGMGQFQLPELLVDSPEAQLEDALDFFFSALANAAEAGSAPTEGETVPRSLFSRPKVRYVASPVESGRQVWKLSL